MRSLSKPALWQMSVMALCAAGLAACSSDQAGESSMPTADSAASTAAPLPAYEPYASVLDLMRGTVTFAAETYWDSVMIVWDADGETVHQPETDEDWQEVWSAAITTAESGNLLMLPRVGYPDDPEWNLFAQQLKDAGIEAAAAAARKDYFQVLDAGNVIYNACTACHETFVPTLGL